MSNARNTESHYFSRGDQHWSVHYSKTGAALVYTSAGDAYELGRDDAQRLVANLIAKGYTVR